MSKNSSRILAVAGLVGIAATFVSAQDASAFGGFGGGFGGHGGGFGGMHASFGGNGGRGGMAMGHSFGGRGFGGRGFGGERGFGGTHLGGHDRTPGMTRLPGRLPPIVRLPPHRLPPIFRPPHRYPPVIVRFPRLPPPVIVRVPPRILPPPVVIGQAPVIVGGGRSVAVEGIRPVAAMAAPAPCGIDGSFVSIVFVPTVTAADITAFLKSYNVTVADGPNVDGIYRIRLSTTAMPQNEVLQVIDSMRSQSAIVASIDGA